MRYDQYMNDEYTGMGDVASGGTLSGRRYCEQSLLSTSDDV